MQRSGVLKQLSEVDTRRERAARVGEGDGGKEGGRAVFFGVFPVRLSKPTAPRN